MCVVLFGLLGLRLLFYPKRFDMSIGLSERDIAPWRNKVEVCVRLFDLGKNKLQILVFVKNLCGDVCYAVQAARFKTVFLARMFQYANWVK